MAEVQSCCRCQAEVAADAPEGLCPACLVRQVIDGRQATEDHQPGRSPTPGFVPPTPAELAQHFPQLEILTLLGQGGMGAVYKARQKKLDRLVALKILPPEVARDPAFAERFSREARSLARLNHPQIVTVHDFGDVDGLYSFTMEYVDGRNLRGLLQEGPLPPAQARSLMLQICDALQYAHDEGLVHRDIKPENILLDRKGRVKVADFGLAKLVGLTPAYLTLTGMHEVMGTLLYMAPEQMIQAHSVDHRADLYSLGVILYEMVTGELPLGRFAPPSRKARVDRELDEVVLKALAREPAERYQDAAAFKQDVEAALAAGPMAEVNRLADSRRPMWPCVRFQLYGGQGSGLLRRDDEALILEFGVQQELRIPLHEVVTLSYGWGWGKPPCKLVLQVRRLAVLGDMPSSQGQAQLYIPYADRDEARRLVKSVGRPGPGNYSESPGATVAWARREVAGPVLGLLISSVLSLLFWGGALGLLMGAPEVLEIRSDSRGYYDPVIWGSCLLVDFLMMPALVQALGAIMMARLRWYPLAATASIMAMIPLTPAFLISLPIGIWTCIVLGKPEVAQAFLDSRPSRIDESAEVPEPRPRIVSLFLSCMRSMAGYILPTMARRTRNDSPEST